MTRAGWAESGDAAGCLAPAGSVPCSGRCPLGLPGSGREGPPALRVPVSAVTEPRQVTALRLRLPAGPTSPGLDAPSGTDEGC